MLSSLKTIKSVENCIDAQETTFREIKSSTTYLKIQQVITKNILWTHLNKCMDRVWSQNYNVSTIYCPGLYTHVHVHMYVCFHSFS